MSDDVFDALEAAKNAFSAGELAVAEYHCQTLLSADIRNGAALHLMGALALHRGKATEALALFEQAATVLTADAALLCNQGEAYRRLGRFVEARNCLEQALQKDNSNPAPHFNLAMVHRAIGAPRLAEHFLRNVLMLDPKMVRAHYELAELYRDEGHASEAEREYRVGLAASSSRSKGGHLPALWPELPIALWSARLGSLLREQGDTMTAIQVLRAALNSGAEDTSVHVELSKCLFEVCAEAEAFHHLALARSLQLGLSQLPSTCVSARSARVEVWCKQNGAQYTVLSRAQWLNVPEPDVMPDEAKPNFRIGKPVTGDAFLAVIPRARVLPRQCAVLTEDSRLFTDGVVNWPQYYPQSGECVQHAADDLRLMLELPEACLRVDDVCAAIGGAGDNYAWMYEALSRIWALEQHSSFQSARVVVSCELTSDRMEMLGLLGIPANRILRLPDDQYLQCRELMVSSVMTVGDWIHPVALQFLRRKFSGLRKKVARKLFLSRNSASHSRLQNESELLPLLIEQGFEVVDSVGATPLDLMEALTDATVVIAFDDETLANLVVVPQGAHIGVIIPEGIYRPRAFFISAQLGHRFTYLVARPDFSSNPLHAHCDVELPKELLVQYIERTLNN